MHHLVIVCSVISIFNSGQEIGVILASFELLEFDIVLKTVLHLFFIFIFSSDIGFELAVLKCESAIRDLFLTVIKKILIKPFVEHVAILKIIPGRHVILDGSLYRGSSFRIQRVRNHTTIHGGHIAAKA